MDNFYVINRQSRWAAVCISKNACTSLKSAVLNDEGLRIAGKAAIHETIGYTPRSRFLLPVIEGKPEGVLCFAVWRDPVERFISTYRHFALAEFPGRLASLPKDPEAWIAKAEEELQKPVLEQEEHLRRQTGYYSPADVDVIIAIDDLSTWFEGRGWGSLPHLNEAKGEPISFSPAQIEKIRALYSEDYKLRDSCIRMNTTLPTLTGLWVGPSLPPLGELCIRSFLDYGFRFQLMTYGKVAGVPLETDILDGNDILPESAIYTHPSGSLAPFSDWFRYRLLAHRDTLWTDLDVACLRQFRMGDEPWFAIADDKTIATGFIKLPKEHPIPLLLSSLAEDPSTPMPWDDFEARLRKDALRKRISDPQQRRMEVRWGDAGPWEFTKALDHFGIRHLAAPKHAAYPIPWNSWRSYYNGSRKLDEPAFQHSLTAHLWGEMLRREPDAMKSRSAHSIVTTLMERHNRGARVDSVPESCDSSLPPPRILVGICSCIQNREKRQAVRETWLSENQDQFTTVFFVGESGGVLTDEIDTVVVPSPDDYESLPAKVTSFFRRALQDYEFEWLFKCDDDTYLALDRLSELAINGYDLVGNEFLTTRQSPSGGAGYLLSRAMVERLAADEQIPKAGMEDILIGEAAFRHGARPLATSRLCWDSSRYPQKDNNVISSHWCTPARMKAIHCFLHGEPEGELGVEHPYWRDTLLFFNCGVYKRKESSCMGTWRDYGNQRNLKWFDWEEEILVPIIEEEIPPEFTGPQRYRCIKERDL